MKLLVGAALAGGRVVAVNPAGVGSCTAATDGGGGAGSTAAGGGGVAAFFPDDVAGDATDAELGGALGAGGEGRSGESAGRDGGGDAVAASADG